MGLQAMHRAGQFFLVLLMGVACSGPVSSPASGPAPGDAPKAPPQRKAITIALQAEVNALATASNQVGINSNPSRFFHEFVNAYLTFRDPNNDVRPWIAAELPAVDAGTRKVAADGSMALTWKLRPGVRSHDGTQRT